MENDNNDKFRSKGDMSRTKIHAMQLKRKSDSALYTSALRKANESLDLGNRFERSQLYLELGVSLLSDDSNDSDPSGNATPPQPLVMGKRHSLSSSDISTYARRPRNQRCGKIPRYCLGRPRRRKEKCGQDYFIKLPDEVVLSVFHWLPKSDLAKCSLVCKRWYRLSVDESLWKRAELGNRFLKSGVLGCVLERGVQVLRLNRTTVEYPIFLDTSVPHTQERLKQLQYVDLTMATITMNGLNELLSACSQLRKISLEHCQVDAFGLCYLAVNKKLDTLNLSLCRGIFPPALVDLLNSCQKLRTLNLSWTNLSSKDTREEDLHSICRALPSGLTELNIAGCRYTLQDEMVDTIVRKCPNLECLDLSDAMFISSEAVKSLKSLANLQGLGISRCYGIDFTGYKLLTELPALKHLEMFGLMNNLDLELLKQTFSDNVKINSLEYTTSTIARPTTGQYRTRLWGIRSRDVTQ